MAGLSVGTGVYAPVGADLTDLQRMTDSGMSASDALTSWSSRNGYRPNLSLGTDLDSALSNAVNGINSVIGLTGSNSARSAAEADKLRVWQAQQSKIARDYNSAEAKANRDWQEYMSGTAYQRAVKDLEAAGLNPALAYQQGSAAVTSGATASTSAPSGAKGDVDTSATAGIVTLLGSLLSAQVSMSNQMSSAVNNLAVADKYNQVSKYTADLQAATSRYNAELDASVRTLQSQLGLSGVKYSADQARAASRYATDQARKSKLDELASLLERQEDAQAFDDYLHSTYPSNIWQAGSAAMSQYARGDGSLFDVVRKIFDDCRGTFSGGSGGGFSRR